MDAKESIKRKRLLFVILLFCIVEGIILLSYKEFSALGTNMDYPPSNQNRLTGHIFFTGDSRGTNGMAGCERLGSLTRRATILTGFSDYIYLDFGNVTKEYYQFNQRALPFLEEALCDMNLGGLNLTKRDLIKFRDAGKGKTWKDWLIIGLLAFVCIQSLFLAKENRNLRRENRKLHFLLYTPTDVYSSQQKAARMFGIRLKEPGTGTESGLMEGIETDYLLLYVFSTDCFSCDASVELWNEVFRELGDAGNVTVRGISRNGLADVQAFVERNRAGFPVYRYDCPPDFDVFASLPQTVLLNKDGQILFSANGIPDDSLKNKILEVIIE